jgi:hypothetical protein
MADKSLCMPVNTENKFSNLPNKQHTPYLPFYLDYFFLFLQKASILFG